MQKNQKKAILFALISIFCWSTAATGFKIGLGYFHFIQFTYFSVLTATFFFIIFLLLTGELKQAFVFTKKQLINSILMALLNPLGYYFILLKAYSVLPAQIAQPLNYTWPVVLSFFTAVFLKEKLKSWNYLALFVSFTGVVIISMQGDTTGLNIKQPFGVFLAVSSSILWSFYWILNVKDDRSEQIKLFLNFLISSVIITPVFLLQKEKSFELNGILAANYIGLFELAIPFIFWLKAQKLALIKVQINNLVFLSPFLSLVFISLILEERIYSTTLFGLIFIISGIFLQQIAKFKQFGGR